MSLPIVRVNNLVVQKDNLLLDPLSKVYVVVECILGINRLALFDLGSGYFVLSAVYNVILLIVITYVSVVMDIFKNRVFWHHSVLTFIKFAEYSCISFFAYFSLKSLRLYYKELDKFDTELSCRPNITRRSILNVIPLSAVIVFSVVVCYNYNLTRYIIPHFVHTMECLYFAHLINLLIPRVRLIVRRLESATSHTNNIARSKPKDSDFFQNQLGGQQANAYKLMELYHRIMKAHEYLIDAVKWQVLIILVSSFNFLIILSYAVSQIIIHELDSKLLRIFFEQILLSLIEIVPLFVPCLCSDQLCAEVQTLRELLGSMLFENKLDKPSRSTIQALLALTEECNLSFSLFQVLDISITLPFSFLSLSATYFIIMLQFGKVLS